MFKTHMEQRDELLKAARSIAAKATEDSRDLTVEEADEINAKGADIQALNDKIKAAKSATDLLAQLGEPEPVDAPRVKQSATLGEYAVGGLKDALAGIKNRRRTQADLAEYKAIGDAHTTVTTGAGLIQPQIDTSIVHQYEERPTIASWLGTGQMTSTAITYFVEKPYNSVTHGGFKTVLENTRKPGITFPDYESVTETLKKIAGWIKLSDEMAEDTPFLASEINNRLLRELLMFEEDQLLNGGGGADISGLLNRSGLQTETAAAKADNLESIFRALMKVTNATGLAADGIAINPIDYQAIRLAKDANGQYFAGGPFFGSYGVGAMSNTPPLWGVSNLIVTTAVPAKTVLVGAGKAAATVYRKGGIRVEAANVDGEDFTNNRFTVLAEERLALAVRQPSAFVKVTLSDV